MLIRCRKCQALFSLQDGVAGVGAGFQVECGRCLEVFQAGAPPKPAPVDPEARTPLQVRPTPPASKPAPPGAVERKTSGEELAKALKPRRPEDDRAREKELGRITLRRGRTALAVGILAGLLALGIAALVMRSRLGGLSPEAAARVERARQRLLRDDSASLEQAGALFTEAARLAPGAAMPEAERAFALLLQAAAHNDLAGRVEDAQEREAHARNATRLLQDGVAMAKAALDDDAEDPAALRALALHAAITGEQDRGLLQRAGQRAPQDPWVAYTRAAQALAGAPSRAKQDRALAALTQARQAEPRMLRAQVDAAAISIDRQETGPARDLLTRVLQENPQHERARKLLSLLPAAPQ
jgi:predicted Zn finger-like uncharacterized protein